MLFSQAPSLEVLDLGRVSYADADLRMMELVEKAAEPGSPDYLLLAEFEPVLTVGRGADPQDFQVPGLNVAPVARGGKATFHGPGQLVAYPILRLEKDVRDLHKYLHALEQALILTVAEFGLQGNRDSRNTGCWIGGSKVASIGVAVRRWVTYHGLALNVSTDLSWFDHFNPCGLGPEIMTTMQQQLGHALEFSAVKDQLIHHLSQTLRHG